VRRQGVGTFVASPRVTYPLVGLHSTRDIVRAHDLALEVVIVEYETRIATSKERSRLQLAPGERVLWFVRSDVVESESLSVSECVIPERFAPALAREEVAERSTYELIEEKYDVQLTRARQTLRADEASARVAGILGIRRGEPVFVLDRLTFDAKEEPVEWAFISYRHDRVECVVELRRQSAGRRESATDAVVRYPV
jgi:GntR family transcriptional regulator